MIPADIHAYLERAFPELISKKVRPIGWSYWVVTKKGRPKLSRILRTKARRAGQDAQLKLAVTSRMTSNLEVTFRGTTNELRQLVRREISLLRKRR